MCNFHQTASESNFTNGRVCSLMTNSGRKTLTDKKFIETNQAKKSETEITSEQQFNQMLLAEFGITN